MLEFSPLDLADCAYLPTAYNANSRLHLSLINLFLLNPLVSQSSPIRFLFNPVPPNHS